MTKNTNGHTVWNLTNRVMAVIDDAGKAQAAVATLERTGVPEHELAALPAPRVFTKSTPTVSTAAP